MRALAVRDTLMSDTRVSDTAWGSGKPAMEGHTGVSRRTAESRWGPTRLSRLLRGKTSSGDCQLANDSPVADGRVKRLLYHGQIAVPPHSPERGIGRCADPHSGVRGDDRTPNERHTIF